MTLVPAEQALLQHVLPQRGFLVEFGAGTSDWGRAVQALRPGITAKLCHADWLTHPGVFDAWASGLGIRRIACLSMPPVARDHPRADWSPEILRRLRIDAIRFAGRAAGEASGQVAALQRLGYAVFRLEETRAVRMGASTVDERGGFLALAPRFFPNPLNGQNVLDLPQLLARHQIRPRGVIHVGAHTCQELPLYRGLGIPRIVFIEANPEICRRMKTELAPVPGVRMENFAIGQSDGTMMLRLMTESQSSSILPLKHHQAYYPEIREEGQVEVPARRLDTFYRDSGLHAADYNWLHLDIQGAELLALRGAESLLGYFQAISIELNYDELYEGCALAEDVEDYLSARGFQLAEVRCPCSPSWGDALFVRPMNAGASRVQVQGRLRSGAPIVSFSARGPAPASAPPDMKVAILYSGLVRTLARTWPSVRAHLGPYRPDIYYYLNEPEKADLVRKILQPKGLLAEPDPALREHDYSSKLGPGVRAVQNDLRQLHGLAQVNKLCRASGIAYDWIFRIRADIEIEQGPEPLQSLDRSFIYIPKSNNWFGYSDRIGFGPPDLMTLYMERYSELHAFMQEGGIFQMEIFLAHFLRKHRIPIARSKINANLVRADGTRIAPSQSLYWNDVP